MNVIEVKKASLTFSRFKQGKRGKGSFKDFFLNKISLTIKGFWRTNTEPFHALNDISFDVQQGEVIGIIGNNGAGKTTLLRLLGNIYQADTGNVKINGTVSTLLSLGTGFLQELNGFDNIFINGLFMGIPKSELNKKIDDIIEFSELSDFIFQPVKTYSSGMKARLGFSIAFHTECEIMLIDEILGVGDKNFKKKSQKAILDLFENKRTVMLVSHSLPVIRDLADRCIWLEKGSIKMIGPAEVVIEAYSKT